MKKTHSRTIFERPSKKAQLTLTFNWIYVLIAGGIILLFFVGIVVKQKSVSETQLQGDVVRILESILTGATVSEQTKNFIDTSGLRDFTLEFVCELDSGGGFRDVFSHYGIQGTSATIETPIEIVFAPSEIKTTELIVWSMPYDLPFKIMDFLFVTSRDTKYYVIGSGDAAFRQELMNATGGLNIEFITSLDEVESGDNFHTRIIDLGGQFVTHNAAVPSALENQDDKAVSAVVFPTTTSVVFYSKKGDHFESQQASPTQIVSIFPRERDAAKFGALFAGSNEAYTCTMMKAFKRVAILSDLYIHATEQTLTFYEAEEGYLQLEGADPDLRSGCMVLYNSEDAHSLELFNSAAQSCTLIGDQAECVRLRDFAQSIQSLNEELFQCVKIY